MNNFTIKDGNYYVLGNGQGNDGNPGTMDEPRATFGNSVDLADKKCVLSGMVEQGITSSGSLEISGDFNARIKGPVKSVGYVATTLKLKNLAVDSVETDCIDLENVRTTLKTAFPSAGGNKNLLFRNNILTLDMCAFLGTELIKWKNLTVKGFYNGIKTNETIIYDSVFLGDFDLYNYNNAWSIIPVFKYSLFLKGQTVFKWNGNAIPVTWTVPGNERQDVIDSLKAYADASIAYGEQKNYLKSCADYFLGEGTLVYDDSPDNVRIFNAYDDSGIPSDLNLNMQNGNPALFSSSEGDYVGALRPAFKVEWDWENMQSLDEDGNVLDEAPDLLQENAGIFVNVNSRQKRNRVKASLVLAFPGGDRLSKIAADFESAADRGLYFGAWQNEVSGLVPLDAFEAEVYDTPTQPSTYPHLLIPFNRDLEIACFKTGDKAGLPVLFSDLEALGVETNKNLTETAGWAVTNGTQEFTDVVGVEGVESRKPRFKYILPVLTANSYN